MSEEIEIIENENDLRVKFENEIINPVTNDYWILVKNKIIDYDFKFPLTSSVFSDHESTQIFYSSFNIKYGLKFKDCTFKKGVQLYHDTSKARDICFENCIFENNVNLRSYENSVIFSKCHFKNGFNARNSIVKGKIRFWQCHFEKEADFRNTKFEGLADFWRSIFYKKTIFYKTDFMDTVVFSSSVFKENVLFTYSLINKLILLRGTKIEKGFDISLAIIHGKLGLFEFNLNNYTDTEFITEEDEYETAVSENAIIPITNKRETFRILKDNLESQKNLSESLKYKSIEKEVLRIELIHNGGNIPLDTTIKNLKSITNNRLDRINLWLNKWSNDHGDSYGRAIIFVFVVGWTFFYFSLLTTEKYYFTMNTNLWNFGEGFKIFIEFLNPLHKFDYIEDTKLSSAWFFVFDFLGKTFVGYGIYQFIQAFRKYK
ncbi:pentapeptide repeat-containing protein [Flavobacterium marginilacus]|uniref:pentapeptide repeat-containing protein n=1 Tax=Flavobacterium marginilacus TaxID=3003256 RepID=UPI00248E6FA3|nr:pentapeptide repeat-containing protein [Flavobacterium marginilacus]